MTLRKILDSLYEDWRRLNEVIWRLEVLASGQPRRGRPPNFETKRFTDAAKVRIKGPPRRDKKTGGH